MYEVFMCPLTDFQILESKNERRYDVDSRFYYDYFGTLAEKFVRSPYMYCVL